MEVPDKHGQLEESKGPVMYPAMGAMPYFAAQPQPQQEPVTIINISGPLVISGDTASGDLAATLMDAY